MPSYEVRAPTDETEFHAFIHHASDAFLGSFADSLAWAERAGVPNVRIVHDGTRVVGGLALLPTAQYFGEQAVSSVGIAGVAIGAEYRGRGAATALMQGALTEASVSGHATSMLYASSHTLYRRVGYELAGERRDLTAKMPNVGAGDRRLSMREATDDDWPRLEELYRARAKLRNGHLARTRFHWYGARHVGTSPCRTSVVEEGGQPTGYITYHQRLTGRDLAEMVIRECIASTPAALQRLLAFISAHACQVTDLLFLQASPDHEAIVAMTEPFLNVKHQESWLLRLIDVPGALVERGYADDISAEVHFAIDDPQLPGNHGRFRMTVEDGEARVHAGGEGDVQLHVRGLAALYSGFATPQSVELIGLGTGLEHLPPSLFAGPAPICADYI